MALKNLDPPTMENYQTVLTQANALNTSTILTSDNYTAFKKNVLADFAKIKGVAS